MSRKLIWEAKERVIKALNDMPEFDGKPSFEIRPFIDYLNRAGVSLHTRYENQCNGFEWDHNGDYTERYDNATDSREKTFLKKAQEFGFQVTDDVNEKRQGAFIRLQTDPRGWPIELFLNGRSYRLGGRA